MKPAIRRLPYLAFCLLLALGACGIEPEAAPSRVEPRPRGDDVSLVVLLVVDQARADYLQRFAPLFEGGLARLLKQGAIFTDAHHEHSMTATAPGHASLSTGLEPASSGIVGNSWIDRSTGRTAYSAVSSSSPAPSYLRGTAIGDWIKGADPASKVFTASAKDRSAVMLGGRRPDGAYWYDHWTGNWESSAYYAGAAREWLSELNARRWPDRWFGTLWEPLEGLEIPPEYGLRTLDTGVMDMAGPHAIGSMELAPGPGFYGSFYDTPYVDAFLLELGKTIVEAESLGEDGSVDLLALSFSALDTVGHDFGPDSAEVLDVLLRLDRLLGELFDFLSERVGAEHLLIAFSADHGVQRLPEIEVADNELARRLGDEDALCVQRAGRRLEEYIGGDGWYIATYHGWYLDHDRLIELGADPADVEARAAELLEECAAIRQVWTNAELSSDSSDEPGWERFKRNYHPPRSPDLTVQFEPYRLYSSGVGTTHLSPYDYDSKVPMILLGRGIEARRISERVATVDLAPTLAELIGVPTPEELDGRSRVSLLDGR